MRPNFKKISQGLKHSIKKRFYNPYSKAGLGFLRVKILKHSFDTKENRVEFLGKRLYFLNGEEFLHTVKEIFVEEIYKISLPPESLIIDCGANIGLSCIYYKSKIPDCRVIAFEPDNINFSILRRNLDNFGFQDVDVRKEAVWIEDGLINFVTSQNMGSHIIKDLEENKTENKGLVKAVRLKNIISEEVGLLKLDIEGAEYDVFMDIEDKLHLIKNIFIEYHGDFDNNSNLDDILRKLTHFGFYYYIKEASLIFSNPFTHVKANPSPYDIQLNIFAFKKI